MVVRCRFCGEKIKAGSKICEHCGKTLVRKSDGGDDKVSLVGIDSWQQTAVPAWLMYLVVGLALLCVAIMFARGCDNLDDETSFKQLQYDSRQQDTSFLESYLVFEAMGLSPKL